MSQHNYFEMTVRAQMEKDPSVLSFDLEQYEANAKKMRAKRDAAAPPPGKADLHKEYNQLRQKLFDLKQDAKCFEIRTNEAAGKIRLFEQRIDDALMLKKAAAEAGNLRAERSYEQNIQRLEVELVDAQDEFAKNKRWSGSAARALKAFDGQARIEELKLVLDGCSSQSLP